MFGAHMKETKSGKHVHTDFDNSKFFTFFEKIVVNPLAPRKSELC